MAVYTSDLRRFVCTPGFELLLRVTEKDTGKLRFTAANLRRLARSCEKWTLSPHMLRSNLFYLHNVVLPKVGGRKCPVRLLCLALGIPSAGDRDGFIDVLTRVLNDKEYAEQLAEELNFLLGL